MMYYDFYGNEISYAEWSEAFNSGEKRKVACNTSNKYGVWVSTVWLGLGSKHNIYETMVFTSKTSPLKTNWNTYFERSATWEKALECHRDIVKSVEEDIKLLVL